MYASASTKVTWHQRIVVFVYEKLALPDVEVE